MGVHTAAPRAAADKNRISSMEILHNRDQDSETSAQRNVAGSETWL